MPDVPAAPKVHNAVEARAILAEYERRRAKASVELFSRKPRELSQLEQDFFLSRCHAKQRAFLLDRSKFIALLCPRRTGKTTASLFRALWTAKEYPRCDIAYIVPSSRYHAKRLFWSPLEHMNSQLKLGLDFRVNEHKVITPENSAIYVFGAKNKESPRILRGNAWALGILDECKDFGPHFEELVIESILPGLEDYDGSIVLEGTPGEVLDGMFYQITHDPDPDAGWSVHKWVKSDNTFLDENKRDLRIIEKKEYLPFGLTKDSPKFRREQLAEWCTDDSERAYAYTTERNAWKPDEDGECRLPSGHHWLYVLGLDLGERDANAFVLGAFSPTWHELFIVYEYSKVAMSIDEIAAETRHLIETYGDMCTMVADTGGYGRGIVTDLALRHNLHFEAADKTGNKLGNIAQMNSDFLCGRIRARDDGPCATEWKRLARRIRNTDRKVLIAHSDLGDAALYMWRASKHYASHVKPVEIQHGSKEYFLKLEQEAVERAVKRRGQQKQWWGPAISDAPG